MKRNWQFLSSPDFSVSLKMCLPHRRNEEISERRSKNFEDFNIHCRNGYFYRVVARWSKQFVTLRWNVSWENFEKSKCNFYFWKCWTFFEIFISVRASRLCLIFHSWVAFFLTTSPFNKIFFLNACAWVSARVFLLVMVLESMTNQKCLETLDTWVLWSISDFVWILDQTALTSNTGC